jgi:hypothetical protein
MCKSPRAPEQISRGSGHVGRKPHRYDKTHVSGHCSTEAQTNAQQPARGPLGRFKGSLESPRTRGSHTIGRKPPGAEAPTTKVSASTRAAVSASDTSVWAMTYMSSTMQWSTAASRAPCSPWTKVKTVNLVPWPPVSMTLCTLVYVTESNFHRSTPPGICSRVTVSCGSRRSQP